MKSTEISDREYFPVSPKKMAELHRRFEEKASEHEARDISYRTLDTPLGTLMLASTNTGLIRIAFEREDFDAVLQRLADSISPRIIESPRELDTAARELEEYFSGRRTSFGLPLDRRLSRGFRGSVQEYLPNIGFGQTVSYKDLAERVGNPHAVRAVGSACATNPLPVVVPCHRVLRTDGSLGGYVGGLDAKAALLELESAA
ncbi:methylated-DNA--[protein]-cysteine S-methyltransferase [Rothia uropygialis]|uniref:methylated-DNA--[protein]-cysteine S-methyltransferase n=1 Tax=Kocuria sp. 36 TaxID=1415402 RepID=UPI00101B9405